MRVRDRLLPTLPCLQRVALILEKEGDKICPFKMIKTDFAEELEFDYAKCTRLVINSFGLEEKGKNKPINISTSIDAAKLTKKYHSYFCRFQDIEGGDSLKPIKAFLVDEHSLYDLQSRKTVSLMKIVLTKKTKDSF